ncbi:hypothetical protein MOX01_10280 [Microbacterium oxydans]|nr:hypothetical protein MOX01_10280 [Microbacterium oxydans]
MSSAVTTPVPIRYGSFTVDGYEGLAAQSSCRYEFIRAPRDGLRRGLEIRPAVLAMLTGCGAVRCGAVRCGAVRCGAVRVRREAR